MIFLLSIGSGQINQKMRFTSNSVFKPPPFFFTSYAIISAQNFFELRHFYADRLKYKNWLVELYLNF